MTLPTLPLVRTALLALMLATLPVGHGVAAQTGAATATMERASGEPVGTIRLTETDGAVLLRIHLRGLPPGAHALHIHETGSCSPGFGAAGGHYAPRGREHGFLRQNGSHAGDLTNLLVPPSGVVMEERRVEAVSLDGGPGRAALLDADGSAFIVHEGPDDYASQPSGAAGSRLLCGVVRGAG